MKKLSFIKYKNVIDSIYYASHEVIKTDRTQEDLKHTRTYSRGKLDGIRLCLMMNNDLTYEEKENLEVYIEMIKEKISVNYSKSMVKIK